MTVTFQAAMELGRMVRSRADLLPSSKLVFDALIDRLNVDSADKRNGQCNPKDETLAADCGLSVSTIKRETRRLVEAGLIVKTRTSRAPVYTFPGLTDSSQVSDQDTSKVSNQDRPRPIRQVTGEPSGSSMVTDLYEQPIEQPTEQPTMFDKFWSVFPRRVGKKTAEKAFHRIAKRGEATADQMIEGAIRYQAECRALALEDRFIKHPATWLNGGCWTDEPAQEPPDKAAHPASWRPGQPEWRKLPDGGIVVWGTSPLAEDWRRYGRRDMQGCYAYLAKADDWIRLPQNYPWVPPESPFPPRRR